MASNSSQSGFLVPDLPVPYDQQLEDILQPTIVGITGLSSQLVRPRFQENPPDQPDRNTNWVAFGINRTISDTSQAVDHLADNSSTVTRQHEFEVLMSFYGPLASSYCEIFRDGLLIGQNRDLLTANSIGVVETGESRKAPALFKEKWLTKYDMTVVFRRITVRTYSILSIGSAPITINTDPVGESPVVINVTS
jgi:hypothetical protein